MRLDILTLFPGICSAPLQESILRRAQDRDLVRVNIVDLRDFTHDRHRTADDRPYGGGAGMVLKPEPLFEAVERLRTAVTKVVFLTPQGLPFTQALARRYAQCEHLLLVCGHYEGIDERAREMLIDEEICIGDYVLTNGAVAAAVVADAVIRLVPGVLGCPESAEDESFGPDRLLEYPQYTRPAEYRGLRVPEILLSGDHGRIAAWRQAQKISRTAVRRPDLLQGRAENDNE